jgi:flagellar protein FliO/FliZ
MFTALAAEPALAQATATPAFGSAPATGLAQVALSLLVVIAAIVACGWLYRRTQGLRGGPGGGVFRVVASQPLGPRERIVVVEIGGKQLVLGLTASQVSTLHVFDEPVVARTPGGQGNERGGAGFAARLRAAMQRSDAA